jgi:hypothetical protein
MHNKLMGGAAAVLLAAVAFAAGFTLNRADQNSGLSHEPQSSQVDDERAPSGTANLYGKLVSADSNLTFQLAEWVRGADNQEQVAIETGRCTVAGAENDECVPNGFFVRDTGKKLTLPLSPNAKIEVYARNNGSMASDANGEAHLKTVSASELQDMLESVASLKRIPFIVTTSHGQVLEVREQYVP